MTLALVVGTWVLAGAAIWANISTQRYTRRQDEQRFLECRRAAYEEAVAAIEGHIAVQTVWMHNLRTSVATFIVRIGLAGIAAITSSERTKLIAKVIPFWPPPGVETVSRVHADIMKCMYPLVTYGSKDVQEFILNNMHLLAGQTGPISWYSPGPDQETVKKWRQDLHQLLIPELKVMRLQAVPVASLRPGWRWRRTRPGRGAPR